MIIPFKPRDYSNLPDDIVITLAKGMNNPFLKAAAERLEEINRITEEVKRKRIEVRYGISTRKG